MTIPTHERVRAQRKKKGWSQERLAEEAGVNVRTVSRVELGEQVAVSTLMRLSAVLGLR